MGDNIEVGRSEASVLEKMPQGRWVARSHFVLPVFTETRDITT